jgi:hypothetical protein
MSGSVMAQGIYSCVDDKGRKLTSDRPIADCMDRVQKELNPSGTVKRVLAPPPSATDRAQMARYPDRASHDKERATALEQSTTASAGAVNRFQELGEYRKDIASELAFYKSTLGKAPPALIQRLDETDANITAQKRLMDEQDAEKSRINKRFDDEAAKLKPQWGVAGTAPASAVPKKP